MSPSKSPPHSPAFVEFTNDVRSIYERTQSARSEDSSKDARDAYAVSICTIDGQTLHFGPGHEKFALESVSKPIAYTVALHACGEEHVHKHVGREPSGRGYNGLVLNDDDLPHNPMVNAGAIMVSSLLLEGHSVDGRFQLLQKTWSRLCGGAPIEGNQEMMEKSDRGSDRNMALTYLLLDKDAFPKGTDPYETIELYNQSCALEMSVEQLAVAGATLANGGTCPLTKDPVFRSDEVRDCLSLMLSCGMYDYSGEFAFLIGLPAKSGVSGAMMIVVPGIMGIAVYSPPLDEFGNSVRGIAFCKELAKEYSLHHLEYSPSAVDKKKDPRKILYG